MDFALSDDQRAFQATARQFARAVGYSDATVCEWIQKKKRPSPAAMAKITEATGGAVTERYFLRRMR